MKNFTLLWLFSFVICLAQEVVEKPLVELTAAEQQNLDLSKQFPRVAQKEDVAKFDPDLLKSAALKGDVWAQFYMGKQAYFEKKYDAAHAWYEKSIPQAHAPSMINKASMLQHGLTHDSKVDYDGAILLYKKAMELGHPSAFYNLACLYRDGEGVKQDEEEAFRIFAVAAALGHGDATSELGVSYEHGRGVEKNEGLAVKFYQKAMGNGSVVAISNLGACYVMGTGVDEVDEKKGIELFRESAEKKCPHGTRMLALCYERGVGVEADPAKAKEWYQKAAALGDQRAKDTLEDLKKEAEKE